MSSLRHLNIFVQVCDEGSMTAAARKLYMAQPSVSQAIAELERDYQTRLFERLGHRLILTVAGQKLLTYARHIIHLSEQARQEIGDLNRQGLVRVGCSVTVGTCVLNELLSAFLQRHPHTRVVPVVDNTEVIESMLHLDQIDLALVEGRLRSPDLHSETFMEDELVLVCPPGHPWAQRTQVNAADLQQQGFIVREQGSGTRELFETVMAAHNIAWQVAGVFNNAESIKQTVQAGLGLTVISRLAVKAEVARGELVQVPIAGVRFQRHFRLALHRNKFVSPALQQFIATVREM